MGKRAVDLADRFKAFNDEVIGFVEKCPDECWGKVSPGERWPVGVVVRHLAASHYGALGLAKLMVAGERLPDLSHAAVDQMNARHAEKHRDCTRDDVLRILRENGRAVVDFVAGLSDSDLDRAGHIAAAGGDVTAEQVITLIIMENGAEHFAHVKAVAGA
ncbi:MAG: DinB family protein [Deltaproteobacteria bacterium]|nr:MAG: DinB family protein [Deltaproteobacteria bacterium]